MLTDTLCTLDTGYYADTVEWCPAKGFEDYLVCGTYQLLENKEKNDGSALCPEEYSSIGNKRVGNVQLYRLNESRTRLEKLQTQETSGILDTKWLAKPLNGSAVLGAATSNGELKIYFLKEKLLVESTSYIASPDKLCLSMDWSLEDENSHIVISDSGGQITLCKFYEGTSELCQVLQWLGHQYEAWITAFNAWNSSIVYSGGDDCLLRGWDTRTGCHKPTFTSKRHEMGVSSIQCNHVYEHIIATGSYDEKIHVWDDRNMTRPLCTSHPGGGVWRIKWHPYHGNTMLTACMYEGFHILQFNNNTGHQSLEKVVSYKEQASLAYGADWYRKHIQLSRFSAQDCEQMDRNDEHKGTDLLHESISDTQTDIVATCSFYDHALNLWTANNAVSR